MNNVYHDVISGNVAQTEPVFGKNQVENNAGGYVFETSIWTTLDRFLIIGSESPTYYVSEQKLTTDNLQNFFKCLNSDYKRTIDRMVEFSQTGRAMKVNTIIFTLAVIIGSKDIGNVVRQYAYSQMNKILNIPTHLFMFLEYVKTMRGWGRSLRRNVGNWYLEKNIDQLIYHLYKYKNRHGWTHKDVLKMAHPKTDSKLLNYIFASITGTVNKEALSQLLDEEVDQKRFLQFFTGYNFSEVVGDDINKAIDLIKQYNFPREIVPTQFLKNPDMWDALMHNNMPMTALIRNLGNMSSCGYISKLSDGAKKVCDQLRDEEAIKRSRVHPINIIAAYMVYTNGVGFKGSNTWEVNSSVVRALMDAFYASFGNVPVTNKKHFVALDISGSMTMGNVGGYPFLHPFEAVAVMAMALVRNEPEVEVYAFADRLTDLKIFSTDSLDTVLNKMRRLFFSATDCSLPMRMANINKIPVDVFSIWTDNETWYGEIHPFKALQNYRQRMDRDSKLVVCATTSTRFSIADPDDPGMLDIVGFDANVHQLISEFALGKV